MDAVIRALALEFASKPWNKNEKRANVPCYDSVWEWMCLGTRILWLYQDDLRRLSCQPTVYTPCCIVSANVNGISIQPSSHGIVGCFLSICAFHLNHQSSIHQTTPSQPEIMNDWRDLGTKQTAYLFPSMSCKLSDYFGRMPWYHLRPRVTMATRPTFMTTPNISTPPRTSLPRFILGTTYILSSWRSERY